MVGDGAVIRVVGAFREARRGDGGRGVRRGGRFGYRYGEVLVICRVHVRGFRPRGFWARLVLLLVAASCREVGGQKYLTKGLN